MKNFICLIITNFDQADKLIENFCNSIQGTNFYPLVIFDENNMKRYKLVKILKNKKIDIYSVSDLYRKANTKFDDNLDDAILDNLFQVDKDRFQTLGFKIPSNKNLLKNFNFIKSGMLYADKNFKICAFFYEGPFNFFCRSVEYLFCQEDYPIYSFAGGRMPNAFGIADRHFLDLVPKNYNESKFLNRNDKSNKLEYISDDAPLQRGIFKKLIKLKNTSIVKDFACIFYDLVQRKDEKIHYYPGYLKMILVQQKRMLGRLLKKYFYKYKLQNEFLKIENRKFLVYSEHFHPEASTSANCIDFVDDVKNVLSIRERLPSKYDIVYKIHPSQFGNLSFKEMNDLISAKGIICILPDYDKALLFNDNCLGIITVNSSMVIDAAKKNILSYCLGKNEVFAGLKDFVHEVTFDDFKKLEFDKLINNERQIDYDWFEERYMSSYLWGERFSEKFTNFINSNI
jgi:hypothetical protein